jgi:hypothetical protein
MSVIGAMFQDLLESTLLAEKEKYVGGWIFPNGKVFHFRSYDVESHYYDAYRRLYKKDPPSRGAAEDAYVEFMNLGNIRFIEEKVDSRFNINLTKKPSSSQMKVLAKMSRGASEFFFTIEDEEDPFKTVDGFSWSEFREAVRDLSKAEK